jgi:ferredoxin-type protein NapF
MPHPLSRRSLLTAVFPFAPGHGATAPCPEQRPVQRIASLSAANACVERHGVVCRRCIEACEHSAIRILAREGRGAVIDPAACTGCGECVPVCPVQAITLVPRERAELVSEIANLVATQGSPQHG